MLARFVCCFACCLIFETEAYMIFDAQGSLNWTPLGSVNGKQSGEGVAQIRSTAAILFSASICWSGAKEIEVSASRTTASNRWKVASATPAGSGSSSNEAMKGSRIDDNSL